MGGVVGPRQLLPDQLLSVFVVTWNMKEMKVRGEGGELEGERERERGRGGGGGGGGEGGRGLYGLC